MSDETANTPAYNSPYKFNGKELDEGTGMYNYGARYYDPRISVWMSVDPLAGKYKSLSSYTYALNNPIRYIDPTGMSSTDPSTHTDKDGNVVKVYADGDLGVYKHSGNISQTKMELANKYSSTNTSGGGIHMGWTLYQNSFALDDGTAMGKIDFNSFAALNWITSSEKVLRPYILSTGDKYISNYYALNAGNGNTFDYKTRNGQGPYFGSQLSKNVYVSARDAGNYLAGSVAKMTGQSKLDFMLTAGAFNLHGNNKASLLMNLNAFKCEASRIPVTYGEDERSNYFQRLGYEGIKSIDNFSSRYSEIWKD